MKKMVLVVTTITLLLLALLTGCNSTSANASPTSANPNKPSQAQAQLASITKIKAGTQPTIHVSIEGFTFDLTPNVILPVYKDDTMSVMQMKIYNASDLNLIFSPAGYPGTFSLQVAFWDKDGKPYQPRSGSAVIISPHSTDTSMQIRIPDGSTTYQLSVPYKKIPQITGNYLKIPEVDVKHYTDFLLPTFVGAPGRSRLWLEATNISNRTLGGISYGKETTRGVTPTYTETWVIAVNYKDALGKPIQRQEWQFASGSYLIAPQLKPGQTVKKTMDLIPANTQSYEITAFRK